jgi:cytochrome c biogenesis protein CcmG, thiol:disulfide interchange protein DsbE
VHVLRKIVVLIAALGLLAAVYLGTHRRPRAVTAAGRDRQAPAPRLKLVDLNGRAIDTASYDGRVVLINFWAAWCTPCAEEIPHIVALQEKYGSQGFQTIGISMDDKEAALREFYQKYKMNYPVIIGNQNVAQEYGGILGLPTSFLVGRDGRIRFKTSGLADFPKLEQEIVALLRTNN